MFCLTKELEFWLASGKLTLFFVLYFLTLITIVEPLQSTTHTVSDTGPIRGFKLKVWLNSQANAITDALRTTPNYEANGRLERVIKIFWENDYIYKIWYLGVPRCHSELAQTAHLQIYTSLVL